MKINDGSTYKESDFVLFNNVDGNIILESITEKSLVIVLSGEPIFTHGQFVMNTKEEIIQAYDDFDFGKFGTFDFKIFRSLIKTLYK
ncbi:pirin-like C-terminal cupin domain-containing protein [Faecalimicrobium sp. JNUCC 81]